MDVLEKGRLLHFTPVHFISDLILSPEESVVCLDVLKFGLRFLYFNFHVYTYILKFKHFACNWLWTSLLVQLLLLIIIIILSDYVYLQLTRLECIGHPQKWEECTQMSFSHSLNHSSLLCFFFFLHATYVMHF